MQLPLSLGRAMAAAGSGAGLTAAVLGQNSGVESNSVTLSSANLPPHSHSGLYQSTEASTSGPGAFVAFNPVAINTGDILVVATGRPKMISGDMVKPGAVVIDVGINRLPDGKLCGDVDFETAKEVAGWTRSQWSD